MDFLGSVLGIVLLAIALVFSVSAYYRVKNLQRELEDVRALVDSRWRQQRHEARVAQPPQPLPEPEPATAQVRQPVAEPPATRPVIPQPAAPPAPGRFEPRPAIDWEAVIGGKWLNIAGLAAVLLAAAFFLKFAFDNNWIGPLGRVTLGLLAGAALILASESMFRRGWTYFSEGVTALGAGILYLSLYAAWNYYALLRTDVAFGGMAIVTAALIVLSLARQSQRLAILALAGGYVTPMLVSTGADAQVQLFSYLALLNAGLLWMAQARDWRSLPGSFAFTLIYGALWYSQFYNPDKLASSLFFASFFFIEFALLPAIQARRNGTLRADGVALTLFNAAWYLFALDRMLYDAHRWGLTAGVLAVAAFYLALANITRRRATAGAKELPARAIFGGVALACLTVAIPIRLQGQWITMAWAVEGVILIWTGLRSEVAWLRTAGILLLAAAVVSLAFNPIPAAQPFLNGRFATLASTAIMLGLAGWLARRSVAVLVGGERLVFACFDVGANVIGLWALSLETWQSLAARSSDEIVPEQLFGLSILWALYATALATIGFMRQWPLARYQAYVLFAIVLLKAAFLDLTTEVAYAHPLTNLRFLTSAVVFASLATSLLLGARQVARVPDNEQTLLRAFVVALNAFAVYALSVEVWQSVGPSAQQLSISLVWVLYAGILIIIGTRRDSRFVRYQALVLFGLLIAKALLVDLAVLGLGYRVVSFLALGLIAIGASFLYQRRLFVAKKKAP